MYTTCIKKILIIDDDIKILNIIEKQLKNEDYNLELINDPEKALKNIFEKDYDLIICDIKMEPINGLEIMKKVKENRPGIPVIILTAYPDDQTKARAANIGSSDFLVKPVRREELIKAINNVRNRY
jgi:DNA-binding NtrC family response regulator